MSRSARARAPVAPAKPRLGDDRGVVALDERLRREIARSVRVARPGAHLQPIVQLDHGALRRLPDTVQIAGGKRRAIEAEFADLIEGLYR